MKSENEKICVLGFSPLLGSGGAEMSLLRLVNNIDRAEFQAEVAVWRQGGAYESDLAAHIPLHVLREGPIWSSIGRLLSAVLPLRRLIKKMRPSVVVAVMDRTNVALLLATLGLHPRPQIVLSVQNNPRAKYQYEGFDPVGRGIFFLMRHLYGRADRIVAISEGVKKELVAMLPGLESRRIEVIHNAGIDNTVRRKMRQSIEGAPEKAPQEKVIVACGRLIKQKGFSYLIDAFTRVHEHIPAQLWIFGEGEKREVLERQTRELGIAEHVWMPGFVDNPYRFMAAADVFVLSSLWEGFGNVVAEAMACGAPVVTTDCPHGPGEIVEGGESGLLVSPADAGALAKAIQRVFTDDALRKRLKEAGDKRAQDFTAKSVAREYEALFQRLVVPMAAPSSAPSNS